MDWTSENIKWFFRQPPPREVDETLLTDALDVIFPRILRAVFYIVPVLLLIMAGIMFTFLLRTSDFKGEWRLMTEPLTRTSGKVLDIEKIKGSKGSITYAYTFEYKPIGHEPPQASTVRGLCFSGDMIAVLGQQVAVEYLPDHPGVSRIEGCRLSFTPLVVVALIPFLGAIAGILPLGLVRYKKKGLKRLLVAGVLASAVIEKIKPGAKGSLVVQMRYALNGAELEAKTNTSGRNEEREWLKSLMEAGQPALILADPWKPKRIFILELLLQAKAKGLQGATS